MIGKEKINKVDGGENKHGAVLMVPFTGDKVYLGGFRNKKSNLVYHHAVTQTVITKKGKDTGKEKFHREAQTTVNITRGQQTKRECGTQMQRKDLMLDTSRDREMQTQKYLDSTEHLFIKSSAVLSIQCYWRGYMARCRAYNIHRARCQRDLEKQKEITRKQVEEEDKQKVEIQRRMNPKTFDDFEILYNELENWRQFETQKVRDTVSDNKEQKEQLAAVLEKETKLLQTINRLKQTANAENRRSRINKMMEVMCRPKKWQLSDGDVQEVHTTTTIRAKELMELYNGVTSTQLTTDERLDVLLHVKWTVNEFDCTLCSEIVDLIDREADMLHRGRKQNTLEGLRKRISNLFLQFIETPEFNPEAAQLDKFAT